MIIRFPLFFYLQRQRQRSKVERRGSERLDHSSRLRSHWRWNKTFDHRGGCGQGKSHELPCVSKYLFIKGESMVTVSFRKKKKKKRVTLSCLILVNLSGRKTEQGGNSWKIRRICRKPSYRFWRGAHPARRILVFSPVEPAIFHLVISANLHPHTFHLSQFISVIETRRSQSILFFLCLVIGSIFTLLEAIICKKNFHSKSLFYGLGIGFYISAIVVSVLSQWVLLSAGLLLLDSHMLGT